MISAPIGLFDSGLGGLTVLKELRSLLPAENFVYLGDTARAPYGSKSPSTIHRYAEECSHFLAAQRIKLLVVACNTASSVALQSLSESYAFPIIGTIEPAVKAALEKANCKKIAVLGTRATIASGAYQAEIKKRSPNIQIFDRACPLFVPLVEEGLTSGALVNAAIDHYLRDIKGAGVDSVILGCTHYPLLVEALRQYFGPDVQFIECSKVIASQVKFILGQKGTLCDSEAGTEHYFVTDEVGKFNSLASLFLKRGDIQAIKVDELLGATIIKDSTIQPINTITDATA